MNNHLESEAPIETRQLFHLDEFAEILRLQQVIWGFADAELVPLRFLVVVSKIGGHVFGAFDGAKPGNPMIGFCFSMPGVAPDGHVFLHSHMLGVLPEYRNTRIGRRLKLRQREEALSRGIRLIEWTFDPMEFKNAWFNIERLGAIIRRYHENRFGITQSPLHAGLPTDRCIAEWWLDSPRVLGALAGTPPDRHPTLEISYPLDIVKIRGQAPEQAREIQKANGEKFREAFARGLAVTGFISAETHGTYLLEPWQ